MLYHIIFKGVLIYNHSPFIPPSQQCEYLFKVVQQNLDRVYTIMIYEYERKVTYELLVP